MAQIKPLDIYLDFFSKDIISIPCTQYDKDSRTLIIHLLDKGKIFNLDSTKHILLFKMTKKDNTKILNEADINSDGTATYIITEQSCIYSGTYDIQFMLIDISDETIIHTMPAKLSITQTVANNVQIESSNEFNALNNLFTDLQAKLYNHYFVLTEDKDIAGGVPSLDANGQIPKTEVPIVSDLTATATELNYTDGVTSNIQTQLNTKAPLANPTLTGTPKAPTASAGTNTTQLATTAFVQTATSNHNTSIAAHSDIRELISELTTRLNALADSDDTTLDQLSEIVAYIKSNRTLIENVTTNKVNVSDIVDNLISIATNKPLSANQGRLLANGSARDDTKLPLSGGEISNDDKSMNITPSGLSGDGSQSISDFYKIEASTFEGKLIGNVEGNATSASKLDISATGSDIQPVYFSSDGVPQTCTYTLAKSVPSNAVFTDTHYASGTVINNSAAAASNTTSALTNGNVYLNHIENGTVKNSHKIVGSGATTVTSDTNGNITINSTDTNTDTKVTQTVTSSNASYPLLLAPNGQTATSTTTSYFDSGVTLNPSTNTIAANISGNATSATSLTTSAGSAMQPVYFSNGKPVACTYSFEDFEDLAEDFENVVSAEWDESYNICRGNISSVETGSYNYYLLKFNNGLMIQSYNIATSNYQRTYTITYPISFLNNRYTILFQTNAGKDAGEYSDFKSFNAGQCVEQTPGYGSYSFCNTDGASDNGYTEGQEFYTLTLMGRWK